MLRTIASERGSTGARSTRWFHGLEAGNTGQPAIAATASCRCIVPMLAALMRLLVTGGAGYIGSIVAQQLVARGDDVTVLDSLFRGHRAAVPAGAGFVQADLRDPRALEQAIEPGYDAALHFAALALVGESVEHPERYWATNVGGTRNLLDRLRETQTPRLVFSSTCATYGAPDTVPMDEHTPTRPQSPYGTSKLAVDLM